MWVIVPHANVRQCLLAIHLSTLSLRERVPSVVEGQRRDNGHPTERINDFLQTTHVDDGVVVDRHA